MQKHHMFKNFRADQRQVIGRVEWVLCVCERERERKREREREGVCEQICK